MARQAAGPEPAAWLWPTAAAIGLVEEFQVTTAAVSLAPGDILLLYTDGVTEAINPREEEFGRERLANLVRQEMALPAPELVGSLRQALQRFTDNRPLADDTTIVAARLAEEMSRPVRIITVS